MTFTAESAGAIRDRALENWRARYLARGEDLDVSEGSDAYNQIDALALEFEGLGLGTQEAARRVLLRYAVGQDLDDFAEDDGTSRKPASAARRVIRLVGPLSSSTAVGGATMSTAGGLRYTPINDSTGAALTAITTDGSGNADVTFECTTPGTTGNLVSGTILTWSSAPVSFAATGTVVAGAGSRQGEDAELDDALRTRLLERRRERPASGNRADWREQARAAAGVGDAFVHCCTLPGTTLTPACLGCMTVIPVNPSPAAGTYVQNADGSLGAGLDPTYSRCPSTGLCDDVAGFLEGTLDANGNAVTTEAEEWFPGTIDRANWGVKRPTIDECEVSIAVKVKLPYVFDFDGAYSVASVTDASHMVLSNSVGLHVGSKVAFKFNAADADGLPTVIRGGWGFGTVATVNLGTHAIALVSPLPAVPPVSTPVRSDPGVWQALLAAHLAYLDTFGPGAPDDLARSERFPSTLWGAPADAVYARLYVVAFSVSGVTDADVTGLSTLGAPIALGHLLVPSFFTLTKMP